MPHIDPVEAARPFHRTMMNSKGDGVSLAQWHHLRPGLHPGTLFGQHKLTAREVPFRLREEKRHLDRKDVLAIEVLMQAVVVPRAVLKKQRRRTHLSCLVAKPDEVGVSVRVASLDSQGVIP